MLPLENKINVDVFDDRTLARLERERKETVKGLLALKNHEDLKKGALYSLRDEGEPEKTLLVIDERVDIKDGYECTKLSKSKRAWTKRKDQERENSLREYKRREFLASLIALKTNLLSQEQDRLCHLNERRMERENNRLKNITRIRWKYKIDEVVPPDSIVFDKIVRYKRERKEGIARRNERMIKIIEKINQELKNEFLKKTTNMKTKSFTDKRLIKRIKEGSKENSKRTDENRDEDSESKLSEDNSSIFDKEDGKISETKEHTQNTEIENFGNSQLLENLEVQTKEQQQEIDEKLSMIPSSASDISNDDNNFNQIKPKQMKNLPKDTCFYANPSIVTFTDFKIAKKYNRKIIIANKSQKWAYLRYHKIETEIWEPGIIEIDLLEAVRIRPGLHVTINVKFSPVNDEKVVADVCFLTLNPDEPETFHEFRIPILCTPERPLVVIDPKEVRFNTAPIWKFDDSKLSEKRLVISNEGGKSFSFLIEERNSREDSFVWDFDDGEPQTARSSILNLNLGENKPLENSTSQNTLNNSAPRKKYEIEVPAKVRCHLRITFHPRYIGLHHDVFAITLLADRKIFDEQNVPLWAEVTGSQIRLNPPCIDLGVVMIDFEVSQQNFDVINTGRSSIEVFVKTPKRLGRQVTIHPRSVVMQPETVRTISVRLIAESSIVKLSKGYYDSVSKLLEFPIRVQAVARNEEKPPPLSLKVLASLTTCHALVLEPSFLDLGTVHTNESVFAELTLKNESLLTQNYGFLNLPSSMEIQPNYGFGAILPGERIKLHLIYSPRKSDIPGNEIGVNGLSGERRFQIEVVTLAEVAGDKKRRSIKELRNVLEGELVAENYGIALSREINKELREIDVGNQPESCFDNSGDFTDSDASVDEKDTENEATPSKKSHNVSKKQRKNKSIIDVLAHIVDTFCEFSEQILEFPATPCGCVSTVSFNLRAFNMASHPRCTCGIVRNQAKEFTARYEFQCSSDRVKVVPQRGLLHSNGLVKVTFIFAPRLSKNLVVERARELKTKRLAEETGAIEDSQKEDKSRGVKKGRKLKKKEPNAPKETTNQEEISEIDKLPGEISLLETFEPSVSTIFATCKIDVEMKDGTVQKEVLLAKLICPITKPEILILNVAREIDFEPTAIGTSARKLMLVKNISNRNVKVSVSPLNPFGPFFIPPGKTIESGTILTLPITYKPIENRQDQTEEYFQISVPKTRTVWRFKVKGTCVVPSWVILPRLRVARFEVADGNPVELKMSIQNTGMCSLTFVLRIVDALKGNIPLVQEDVEKGVEVRGRKKIDGVENKGRISRKLEFTDALREREELAIFGGELERLDDRNYFSFRNFNEKMELTVRENAKVEFAVRFHPPKERIMAERGTAPGRIKPPLNMGDASFEKQKSNYCYVGLFKLMLGSSTFVQDLVMICSLK